MKGVVRGQYLNIGNKLTLIRGLSLGWGANAILQAVRLHMSSGVVLTWPWSKRRGIVIGFIRSVPVGQQEGEGNRG